MTLPHPILERNTEAGGLALLRAYGVSRSLREGIELAVLYGIQNRENGEDVVDMETALWALTMDASKTHGGGRWLPRERGSYWPEVYHTVEEIWEHSRFEQASGDLVLPSRPPTAKEITRADAVHEAWRNLALRRKGSRPTLLKACWLYASGVKTGAIRRQLGLSRQRVHSARREGLSDIAKAIDKTDKI